MVTLAQVFGVGGGGSNAVNNMVNSDVQGVEFWIANTDAQVSGCPPGAAARKLDPSCLLPGPFKRGAPAQRQRQVPSWRSARRAPSPGPPSSAHSPVAIAWVCTCAGTPNVARGRQPQGADRFKAHARPGRRWQPRDRRCEWRPLRTCCG